MTLASVGSCGAAGSSANNMTSFTVATTAVIEVGNLVIGLIASDNTATTDTSANKVTGITDPSGNTWTKIGEATNGQGAAQAGTVVAAFYCVVETEIGSGVNLTVALGGTSTHNDAAAATFWEFTRDTARPIELIGNVPEGAADGVSVTPALTVTGLDAVSEERLYVGGFSHETGSSFLDPANDNPGLANLFNGAGSLTTHPAAAEQCIGGWFLIATESATSKAISSGTTRFGATGQTIDIAGIGFAMREGAAQVNPPRAMQQYRRRRA